MKEQLITFETAKLAKEKGFNEWHDCMQVYYSHDAWDKWFYPFEDEFIYSELYKRTKELGFALNNEYPVPLYEPYYRCPTQALLAAWLREKYGIQVYAVSGTLSGTVDGVRKYKDYVAHVCIASSRDNEVGHVVQTAINDPRDEEYQTYELAMEAGLLYALKQI